MSDKNLSRRDFLKLSLISAGATLLASCTQKAPEPATSVPTQPAAEKEEATKAPEATEAPEATKEPEATKPPEPTAAPAGEPMLSTELDSPVKFSYLRPVWGPATHQKGSDYELELFKRANVEIESQIVPVFDYEVKFPVLAAGGTLADLSWHAGPNWGPAHDLIEQGAFLPLDPYLEKYPAVRDAVGDTLWTLTRSPDGHNYFFPMPLAAFVPFPISYRTDIYDELGLSEPETLEEFVAQLEEIKAKKPDMIPITAHEYSLWYWQNTAISMAYPWGNWVPAEGEPEDNPSKIVPGNVVPEFKDFLLFVQSLRKKGVIDPDYMVTTGLKGIDKFRAGNAVCMTGHWGTLADDNNELRKVVPDGDISYMKQLMGPKRPMGALTLSGFDRGFSISIKAEDKADNIFKFLNWVYTEGYDFMRYGVEGKTYKMVDGKRVGIPDTEREVGWQGPNIEPFGFPPKQVDVWPKWDEMAIGYEDRGVLEKLPDTVKMFKTAADNAMPNWNHLTFSPTSGEKGSQLFEQYTRPMQETFAIDPDFPPEKWDEAVKNWLDNGGQQIIDEVNEIQQDKSPIKPVYEVPDEFKHYLE